MRKCLVTLAIGEKHLGIERRSRPFREHYAKRHGYDYRVVQSLEELSTASRLPEDLFPPHAPLSFQAATFLKLFIPRLAADYDFAVFMDGDTVLHPNAPCLSAFEPQIPQNGFAAVQTVTNELASRFFPLWAGDYYLAYERKASLQDLPLRHLYVNSGLLAFRPREVAERWPVLLEGNGRLFNEESLLNIHEVQQGRCFLLPPQWNVLWYYKKHYMGWLKPANSWTRFQLNRVKNKASIGEKWLANQCFASCHMMHFAFEHQKMRFIEAEKWIPKV